MQLGQKPGFGMGRVRFLVAFMKSAPSTLHFDNESGYACLARE